ncbi:MAG: AAA domain-containing protein [Candidatus Nanosynbacter sp. HMT-348_TM7c-JB]|jgi:hypothetical protein|nr:MAG: AAA domain-containing protein [Candidatus Nanosynbacter sp. HMT-348_TM7c-JB]
MTKIPVSISQLAQYGLDYVSLVSGDAPRGRPVKTDKLDTNLLPVLDVIFKKDIDSVDIDLITSLDKQFNPNIPNEEKSNEQRQAEERIARDRDILNKLQEIDAKIKTDEYTKRVVLQTGFVSFEAKRYSYINNELNEEYESYETPLFQVPVAALKFKYTPKGVVVTIELSSNYVEILSGSLRNFLPQEYFSKIFEFITDAEAKERTITPLEDEFIKDLWSIIKVQLNRLDARSISETPSFATSLIGITSKTNHFLAEDLKNIASLEDEELLETSLSSWASDENMNIEQEVTDDGSTEILFPFDYDKYQLKVLGVTANKAVIVEGPPGTGKSQTISNLLVHLAATGKRVLFASQKDQAIRGVKDKLKTLEVPFLYGYIPDKTSKLYTEDDEKDSAANTLLALNREFKKKKVGDLKEPLTLLADRSSLFAENLNNERSIYSLLEERRSLNYLDAFYTYKINDEWYSQCVSLEDTISRLKASVNNYEKTYGDFLSTTGKKFEDLEFEYQAVIDGIEKIRSYIKDNMPERAGWVGSKVNKIKLRSALNEYGRDLLQEIYVEIEKIISSETTKSNRLRLLNSLSDYFIYASELQTISDDRYALDKLLSGKEMPLSVYASFKKVILNNGGKDKVFQDLAKYDAITKRIDETKLYSTNELNREIKDIRKFYKTNVTNYIRNRILKKVSEANDSKNIRATLAQVARSLTKSKKANKTFDRLKHNADNFSAMSKVLPIWMMSLDDISRIIPLQKNIFDYVIIDEASQCNFAYAFPVMFRAKHTIFFGDTLQMRDDNIMFKSNDQLNAIAQKHQIPELYQIKAEEDTVKSVMDIARLNGFKTVTLKYHYRSPKELIGFSNESFYEPIGRRLEAVNDNIIPYKDTGRVLLVHVVTPDLKEDTSDKTNSAEIRKVQELISCIKNDHVLRNKSIAVLTFFNEQAELMRRAIKDDTIKVSIIDGIQGDERDIIIYSFVIKDPADKKRYIALTGEGGEIRKDIAAGRVNVAFSRARAQVHAVTSLAPELWPEGIWIKRYLEYIEKNGAVNRRHDKSKQQFDSDFERRVYDYLANKLDANEYVLETQVESLGFRIDLVVYHGNKKLAIEMDGPCHFEDGDGQVYVKNDWERQGALETAGWDFYRISYFDWIRNQDAEKNNLVNYIQRYFTDGATLSNETSILRELKKETALPEEVPKNMYITDFADEYKDNVSSKK